MASAFEYRPKFVDIRVKKSGAKTVEREPENRPCDHTGCKLVGAHRAPKSREHTNQYWHFCREHVTEYNRRWNYFSGMSDAEMADYQKAEETGHRPTWTFRSGRLDQFSAAQRGMKGGRRGDPFSLFGSTEPEVPARPQRRLTRLQAISLEAMSLEADATGAQIRTRYAELVKRWHPDSNGGDRGAEANLQRVVQAYQTLKAGGLV